MSCLIAKRQTVWIKTVFEKRNVCLKMRMEAYRSGHNEAVLKTVWVKAHGGSNPSSSATKTRQILSGFLLLRKRASCAICDCTRLRRRTPYHGADASLLRVNSPAPLLNESSSSANKTDKHFCLSVFVFRYLIRGIRTRALRKRHSASFLAAARRLLQSIKTADQGCFAKDKNESLFLRHKNPTYFVGFFVASEE